MHDFVVGQVLWDDANMRKKVIAILEARAGEHMAELIVRHGAVPLLAPALEEMPDVDPVVIAELVATASRNPFKVSIFQTGVGTRALFATTDSLGITAGLLELLRASTVIVRGPKPVGELNARGVTIAHRAAPPFTTDTVLACVSTIDIQGTRVLIQQYGAANRELREALEARDASVIEVATYRWALPADTGPLIHLLDALCANTVDAVVFTSAVQIHNLVSVAQRVDRAGDLPALLNRCLVASIGPVCSKALIGHGIQPRFEANPPKLGPLLAGLEMALATASG